MITRIAFRRLWGKHVGMAIVVTVCGLTFAVACTGSGGSPSSSPAEWRSSVCDPSAAGGLNALAEGIDASDLHVCASRNAGVGAAYIVSGKYSSSDRLQYYLTNHAAFQGSPYATASASDGGIWAFVAFVDGIGQGDPAVALKPLKDFNFEIHTRTRTTPSPSATAQPYPTSSSQPTGQTSPDTRESSPTGTVESLRASTRIQWSGALCINNKSARRDNKTQTATDKICSDNGTWRYSEESTSGQFVGGDPIMGDADWISCQLYINGKLEFEDRADAGDGTDVNCLRTVN